MTFFERDVPWYAEHRDLPSAEWIEIVLYGDWMSVAELARKRVERSDVTIVTSYCPEALAAEALASDHAPGLRIFYDLDSAVTLARLDGGEPVEYVGPHGYASYDLVLTYTGGRTIEQMHEMLGARRVAPLYGWADPERHFPVEPDRDLRSTLSYLATYSADRHQRMHDLFLEPARSMPEGWFILGGSMYPNGIPWPSNVLRLPHVPPARHPVFYCSAALNLNLTRGAMAATGYCPSGRLFEAAACGATMVSDSWEGLDRFFEPGREILIATSTDDVLAYARLPTEEKRRIGEASRERCLSEHTADRRADELLARIGSPASDPALRGFALEV